MADWREYLTNRGISAETAAHFHLSDTPYEGRPSLKYLTVGLEGNKGFRVKFTDGQKPKYKWWSTTKQPDMRYYSPGGLAQAIKDAQGVLYWLSGEPDVWTLFDAMGFKNATCSMGEGIIPDSIVADLNTLVVKTVRAYPDLDDAGMKAIGKLSQRLRDSGIRLEVYRLPGEHGSKRDLNQLWQDVKFDSQEFKTVFTLETLAMSADEIALWEPTRDNAQTTIDFGSLYGQWIDDVVKALGPHHVRDGTVYRWRCPLPGHADNDPSFRVADGTPKMPMCSCGIQDKGATDAWNEVAAALHCDNWDEYKARHKAQIKQQAPMLPNVLPAAEITPSANGHAPDMSAFYQDSHTVYSEIMDHLEGKNLPDTEYIEFPLQALHRFGGFAEIMFPGKLVYVVGISGGGKTSLAEKFGETFLRWGYDGLWYGPEWSPYEMGLRGLQRSGGADVVRMAKSNMYNSMAARGIPAHLRKGVPLNAGELEDNYARLSNMLEWPGRMYWLTSEANKLSLTDMLTMCKMLVEERRAAGRKVTTFFFDYLQRARLSGRSNSIWSEEVIAEIKAFCEEMQLIGFVIVQPRKNDSQGTRDGDDLTEASGQGISDQQCNLYLAIQPIFDMGEKTNMSKIKIVKNSMGRLGEILLPTQLHRLTWADTEPLRH